MFRCDFGTFVVARSCKVLIRVGSDKNEELVLQSEMKR